MSSLPAPGPEGGHDARARRDERRVAWSARLGLILVRLLARTWRYTRENDGPWRAIHSRGAAHILAVWHGTLLPAVWMHRGEGLVAMVSEHRDGEIITRIIAGLGYDTARGSTTRGGSRALLALVRLLQAGKCAAFTPDGPRGPRHVMQPGIVAAARRSGVPVVMIGVAASSAWTFRSWDRFTLPKPFARVALAYSDPLVADATEDDAAADLPRFAAAMHDADARAERMIARD